MPSAEEGTYLFDVASQNSFTSRDVDVLVSRIKENLRLTGLKSRSSLDKKIQIRPSPYKLPSRSWTESSTCELCAKRNTSVSDTGTPTVVLSKENHQHRRYTRKRLARSPTLQDSYERFEALLRRGALIKEAVKRLQTSPDVDYDVLDVVDDDANDRCPTSYSTTVESMDDD